MYFVFDYICFSYYFLQVEMFCHDKYDDKFTREEKAANESIRKDIFKENKEGCR